MAWRPIDVTVFIVDVGVSMCTPALAEVGGKVTLADLAMRLARNAVQQKLLFLPRHHVGIVFFGTMATQNELQNDGYPNVVVARDGRLDAPDLPALRALTEAPQGGAQSDAVNAMIVAMDLLIRNTKEGKWNRRIVLLTDATSASFGDEDLVECAKQLELTNTRLSVTLLGAPRETPWSQLSRTQPQVELLPLAALAHESGLSVKPVELRAKVRLNLVVSPDMQIPVGVYTRTTRVGYPTLKRRSKLAAAVPADVMKTDAVVVERTYHVADDPDGMEVVQADRIKGHRYGQSIVPMSEYDEAALMYSCDRTLLALAFTPKESIGPEHNMSHIEAVAADRGDHWAFCACESLVEAMEAEGVVMIARYSFRKNAQPKVVALHPKRGEAGNMSTLEMQYLPFYEDVREWSCSSLAEPSREQRDAINLLVDALESNVDAGAVKQQELFRPEESHNPSLARFYQFLTRRAMDAKSGVPPPGPECALALQRTQAVEERLAKNKLPEQLKAAFGLEKVEKKQGRVKRFWREAIEEKRKGAPLEDIDTRLIKVQKKEEKKEEAVKDEDKVEASAASSGMAAAVGVPVRVHIGSVHPERDFEAALANRTGGIDVVADAVRQMRHIIERCIDEGEEFHGKALGCATVLRSGCVREAEVAAYNDFVRMLSLAFSARRVKFWERVRESRLGLITDAEVPTSIVTEKEAKAFLAGEEYLSARDTGVPASAAAAVLPSEMELEAMLE